MYLGIKAVRHTASATCAGSEVLSLSLVHSSCISNHTGNRWDVRENAPSALLFKLLFSPVRPGLWRHWKVHALTVKVFQV